ncbi:hypothetical protein Naga_100577g6 [Nannochloropsis gaditana]|uniref:Uncharacterized protein n=1 Tax=Nannochloropsis gaditana TaxID=72520 RepID=W7TBT3_9STRA|nr:hypothetical protein Naga_100577g6 [Nannochloropsis gaditana]
MEGFTVHKNVHDISRSPKKENISPKMDLRDSSPGISTESGPKGGKRTKQRRAKYTKDSWREDREQGHKNTTNPRATSLKSQQNGVMARSEKLSRLSIGPRPGNAVHPTDATLSHPHDGKKHVGKPTPTQKRHGRVAQKENRGSNHSSRPQVHPGSASTLINLCTRTLECYQKKASPRTCTARQAVSFFPPRRSLLPLWT